MAGFVRKTIALVAHDNRKKDLVEWVEFNSDILIKHKIICTGTTGKLVRKVLENKYGKDEVDIHILKSGPLGGDQQLGAMIAEGKVDILIFLWDPMEPMPHDVDVKALLRIATLYNIPVACPAAKTKRSRLNQSGLFGVTGEHGLAVLIEKNGEKILFDACFNYGKFLQEIYGGKN